MTFDEYQEKAARTINVELTDRQIQNHALLGLSAEVGELLSIFQKAYQGHSIDPDHVRKECGDILWMLAEFCTINEFDLSEIAETNISKLLKRYPDGFKIEKSIKRASGDI